MAAEWVLAVDFGTSFTVAAVCRDGGVPVALDLAGDGTQRVPSAVALGADGGWLVGRQALSEAQFAPERCVRAPKRLVGQAEDVPLEDRLVPVSVLLGAVLGHVRAVALRHAGGVEPRVVRLTCPATWAAFRQRVL